MRFIVNRYYSMIGYRDRRYGLCNNYTGDTCFFMRAQYDLIRKCDGKQEIDPDAFSEEERGFFDWLLKNYFIRPITGEETLTPQQEYRLYPNAYRDSVHWSITGSCNCRCRHCFVSAPHAVFPQLSLDECMTMLDQFEACGIKKIGLTGGEPLSHPDFKTIVEEIKKRNLVLGTLYTNGLLFSDDVVRILKDNVQSPDVQISFDGLETHDWLRGIKGAKERTIAAIRRCAENNFLCHISMMLFKDNLDQLADNIRFLDSLGVSSIKVSLVENLGEWTAYHKDHGISREEAYEAFLQYIPQCLKEKPKASVELGGFFRYEPGKGAVSSGFEKNCTEKNADQYLLCGSLKTAFYVNSDGRVFPCITMMQDGNVYDHFSMLERPLADILDDPGFYAIGSKTASAFLDQNPECMQCKYRYQCLGGCRAKALLEANNAMGIDPEVCAYFKGGWKERKDLLIEQTKNNLPA